MFELFSFGFTSQLSECITQLCRTYLLLAIGLIGLYTACIRPQSSAAFSWLVASCQLWMNVEKKRMNIFFYYLFVYRLYIFCCVSWSWCGLPLPSSNILSLSSSVKIPGKCRHFYELFHLALNNTVDPLGLLISPFATICQTYSGPLFFFCHSVILL